MEHPNDYLSKYKWTVKENAFHYQDNLIDFIFSNYRGVKRFLITKEYPLMNGYLKLDIAVTNKVGNSFNDTVLIATNSTEVLAYPTNIPIKYETWLLEKSWLIEAMDQIKFQLQYFNDSLTDLQLSKISLLSSKINILVFFTDGTDCQLILMESKFLIGDNSINTGDPILSSFIQLPKL